MNKPNKGEGYDIDTLENEVAELKEEIEKDRKTYEIFKNLRTNNIFKVNPNIFALGGVALSDIRVGLLCSEENWGWYTEVIEEALPIHKKILSVPLGAKNHIEGFSVYRRKQDIKLKSKFFTALVCVIYCILNIHSFTYVYSTLITILKTCALGVLTYNSVLTVLNYYNFVICVNRYINHYVKEDYCDIIKNYEEKQKTLKLKKDILEAAKVTRIKPESIVEGVKRTSANGMKLELKEVRCELSKIKNEVYRKHLDNILEKCDSLLDYCASDSKAMSEISGIYNIYINEVLNAILKYGDTKESELVEMLGNFEIYVDNKIAKYKAINDIAFKSDIVTLNNIFKSGS